jgi:hypothetical protein
MVLKSGEQMRDRQILTTIQRATTEHHSTGEQNGQQGRGEPTHRRDPGETRSRHDEHSYRDPNERGTAEKIPALREPDESLPASTNAVRVQTDAPLGRRAPVGLRDRKVAIGR